MNNYNLVFNSTYNENEEKPHAILSGSQTERFMMCPGSVNLIKQLTYKDSKSSQAAEEGTFAHKYAELLFRKVDGQDVVLPEIPAEYDQDMPQHCAKYVRDILDLSGEKHIEVHLDFKNMHPSLGGSSDVINLDRDARLLRVCDLKFGKSQVYAKDNKQLLSYAVGALITYKLTKAVDTVELRIYQPRGKDNFVSYSIEDVMSFGKELKLAAHATDDPLAPLVMTDKGCFWCKAKPICPEFKKKAKAMALTDFGISKPKTKAPSAVAPEKLAEVLQLAKDLAPWCEAVFQQAKDVLAEDIDAIPGWGLKQGRKMQSWKNADNVRALIDDMLSSLPTNQQKIIYSVLFPIEIPSTSQMLKRITIAQEHESIGEAEKEALQYVADELNDLIHTDYAASSLSKL